VVSLTWLRSFYNHVLEILSVQKLLHGFNLEFWTVHLFEAVDCNTNCLSRFPCFESFWRCVMEFMCFIVLHWIPLSACLRAVNSMQNVLMESKSQHASIYHFVVYFCWRCGWGYLIVKEKHNRYTVLGMKTSASLEIVSLRFSLWVFLEPWILSFGYANVWCMVMHIVISGHKCGFVHAIV
jgi:hypothetical protein